ncbi:MAG: NlpC/P60 family protein, partial [Chlamydiota bacterium]
TYTKECYRECAPWQTDCLSAIRYLFKKSSRNEFELDFVGNMPKTLYRWGWSILRVKKTCLKAGDLIFVGTNKRQISHVAIALSSEQIYHSSQKKNGCIEKIETLFREYLQPKTISELLAYTDERGTLSKRFYQKHSRVVQSCRNH